MLTGQKSLPKWQKMSKISYVQVKSWSFGGSRAFNLHLIFEIRTVLKSGWPQRKCNTTFIGFWAKEKFGGFGGQYLRPRNSVPNQVRDCILEANKRSSEGHPGYIKNFLRTWPKNHHDSPLKMRLAFLFHRLFFKPY